MGSVFAKGVDNGGGRRVVSAQDDDDDEELAMNGHKSIELKVMTEADSNFDREVMLENCVGSVSDGQLVRVQIGGSEVILLPSGEVFVKNP